MKKMAVIVSLMLVVVLLCACGGKSTCAKCGKEFTGTKYQNVIVGDGTGVLCEDCAGYEYGVDMNRYKK